MTLIVWLPLLVGIVGLVLYLAVPSGKIQELGRLMFFAGLLVWLFLMGGHVVRI